ncbi:hypothetical protein MBLNU230_g6143t1 [Neophaeotheca triangularis]
MARTLVSQETSEALDVSQDYETPPKASIPLDNQPELAVSQADDSTQLVKDSLENHEGGAVQLPGFQAAAEDNQDDLYETSPQAKVQLVQKSATQRASQTQVTQPFKNQQREAVLQKGKSSGQGSPRETHSQGPVVDAQQGVQAQQAYSETSQAVKASTSAVLAKERGQHGLPAAVFSPSSKSLTRSERLQDKFEPFSVADPVTDPFAKAMPSQRTRASGSQVPPIQTSHPKSKISAAFAASGAYVNGSYARQLGKSGKAFPASAPTTTTSIAPAAASTPLTSMELLKARKNANASSQHPASGSQISARDGFRAMEANASYQASTAPPVKTSTAASLAGEPNGTSTAAVIGDTASTGKPGNDPNGLQESAGGKKTRQANVTAKKKGAAQTKKDNQPLAKRAKQAAQRSSTAAHTRKDNGKGQTQVGGEVESSTRITRAAAKRRNEKPAGMYAEKSSSDEPDELSVKYKITNGGQNFANSVPKERRKGEAKVIAKGAEEPLASGKEGKSHEKAVESDLVTKPSVEDMSHSGGAVVNGKAKQIEAPKSMPPAGNGVHINSSVPPGASQDAPIVLSDRPEQSSDPELEPADKLAAPVAVQPQPRGVAHHVQAPETPANLRSSPPLRNVAERQSNATSRIQDSGDRKPKIIGFSRAGPLNQGSASARKQQLHSASMYRPIELTQKIPLAAECSRGADYPGLRRTVDRSSMAPSARSTRTDRSAAPSNVAEDVSEALAGLLGRLTAPADLSQSRHAKADIVEAPAKQSQMASVEPNEDDEGYVAVDDFEGPPFAQHDEIPAAEDLQRPTDSQIAMPPPPSKPVPMPKVQRAPIGPVMLGGHVASRPHADTPRRAQFSVSPKRAAEEPSLDSPPAKHQKARSTPFNQPDDNGGYALANDNHSARQTHANSSTDLILDTSARKYSSRAAAESQVQAPPKTDSNLQLRGQRKASRYSSQGQTVDVHGSPVPDALDVPYRATVLETFSQQNQGSSEDGAVLNAITSTRKSDIGGNAALSARPTRKLSRNAKTMPGLPDTESRAPADMVSGRLASRHLVRNQKSSEPDPFTSSEDATAQGQQRRRTSAFLTQLMEGVAKEQRDARIGNSNDQINDGEQPDPDETLVEPEPTKRVRHGKTKDYESESESSSSGSSVSSEETVIIEEDDMVTWRNGLKPHQMNLFDELVSVSHQLVRHIVDKETATQHILSDYRRRGENLIKQMQLLHKARRSEHIESLKKRKRAVGEQLDRAVDELGRLRAGIENEPADEPTSKRSRLDADAALQQALEVFC